MGRLRTPVARRQRPARGQFRDHFTFAQALTESAKLADRCLLVISLPASDTSGSPTHRRTTSRWGNAAARSTVCERGRPRRSIVASGQRRGRLRDRSAPTVRSPLSRNRSSSHATPWPGFYDLYRTQHQEFPPEARDPRRRAPSRVSDPSGGLRPALHRLVHAGEVPAHAACCA